MGWCIGTHFHLSAGSTSPQSSPQRLSSRVSGISLWSQLRDYRTVLRYKIAQSFDAKVKIETDDVIWGQCEIARNQVGAAEAMRASLYRSNPFCHCGGCTGRIW
jgi:hypothetical protein